MIWSFQWLRPFQLVVICVEDIFGCMEWSGPILGPLDALHPPCYSNPLPPQISKPQFTWNWVLFHSRGWGPVFTDKLQREELNIPAHSHTYCLNFLRQTLRKNLKLATSGLATSSQFSNRSFEPCLSDNTSPNLRFWSLQNSPLNGLRKKYHINSELSFIDIITLTM